MGPDGPLASFLDHYGIATRARQRDLSLVFTSDASTVANKSASIRVLIKPRKRPRRNH